MSLGQDIVMPKLDGDCDIDDSSVGIPPLSFDPAQVTLIIPIRSMADSLREEHRMKQRRAVSGAGSITVIQEMPWHFLALEDLGLTIDFG